MTFHNVNVKCWFIPISHVFHLNRDGALVAHDSFWAVDAADISDSVFCVGSIKTWRGNGCFMVACFHTTVHLWWPECLLLCNSADSTVHWRELQVSSHKVFDLCLLTCSIVFVQTFVVSTVEWAEGHILRRSNGATVRFATDHHGASMSCPLSRVSD